ncbi:MAG: ATP-binding protein [Sulfobacillus sp.]
MAAAMIDRLAHHAHLIQFSGDSYRFRDSLRSRSQEPDPSAGLA